MDHDEARGLMMSDRIVIDPAIQHGKPVIRGTRVPVVRILGGLAGGMTPPLVASRGHVCSRSQSVPHTTS